MDCFKVVVVVVVVVSGSLRAAQRDFAARADVKRYIWVAVESRTDGAVSKPLPRVAQKLCLNLRKRRSPDSLCRSRLETGNCVMHKESKDTQCRSVLFPLYEVPRIDTAESRSPCED